MPGASQILIIMLHGRHYYLAPSQVEKLDFGFGFICNPKPALFPRQSSFLGTFTSPGSPGAPRSR